MESGNPRPQPNGGFRSFPGFPSGIRGTALALRIFVRSRGQKALSDRYVKEFHVIGLVTA